MNSARSKEILALLVAALLVLPALTPTLTGSLPPTADGQVHLHRIVSAALNLRAGLWPRWGPHLYLGYGYPIHNFYAPGVHIVAGLMVNAGLHPVTALLLVQAAGLALYAMGAYRFARTFLPARAALLGAAVYAYAPFRFRELWVQGNLSQFVAMGLMPWALWALARAVQRPGAARAAGVAVTFAALILAHHPTAFLFAPFAVAYALFAPLGVMGKHSEFSIQTTERPTPRFQRVASSLGGLALGLALAAIFWLPALIEMQHVDIGAIERGMFNVSLNFVEPGELLAPSPALDRAALNPPMPHNLGAAQVALAVLGLVALHPRFGLNRWARLHVTLGAAGLLVCAAMVLPAAEPVWRALPLGSIVAFPWRLVGVAEVCMIPLAAAALNLLPARWRDAGLGVGLALTLALAAVYLYPIQPALHFDAVTPATAIAYELESGALGTVSADEYLPRWVEEPPPPEAPPDLSAYRAMQWRVLADEDSLPESVALDYEGGEIVLGPGESLALRLRQFYFPGWQARVDGAPVEVRPEARSGLIVLDVPPSGAPRRVAVWYGATALQAAATLVSVAALALCVGFWAWSRKRRGRKQDGSFPDVSSSLEAAEHETPSMRTMTTLIAAIVLVTAINQLIVIPHTDWFRPRSDPASPAMMQRPVHARLGDAVELLGYDLDRAEAAQGDTVTVRLYWRALRPLDADYRPFVHWDNLTGTETWANSTLTMPGSAPTSRWDSTLYVIDEHRLAIPRDAPPVIGNLTAGLFDAATGDRLGDKVLLTRFRVTGAWDIDRAFDVSEAVTLGGAIRLLHGEARREGDAVFARLYWQADAPAQADYTVFLHVLGADGARVGQGDRPPLSGDYPTSAWLPGQAIPDEATIPLEAGAEGPLTLAVGLYDPATVTRLEARAADGTRLPDDAILIAVDE